MSTQTFTINSVTLTVNVDVIDEDMIRGMEWWKKGPPHSRPLCPFVIVQKSCKEMCGQIFPHLESVYKTCPFKSNIWSDDFLKELVEKLLEFKRKEKADKKMSSFGI